MMPAITIPVPLSDYAGLRPYVFDDTRLSEAGREQVITLFREALATGSAKLRAALARQLDPAEIDMLRRAIIDYLNDHAIPAIVDGSR